MRIWLITVGEPLPTDGGNRRLIRTGVTADMLAARGDAVLWWTSAFDHVKKSFRCSSDSIVEIAPNYRIAMLHAPAYRSNISLARLRHNRITANHFRKLTMSEMEPDIILCSLPTLELAVAAVEYGRKHRVPVVIDVRDLWPDIFEAVFPPILRPLAHVALGPLYNMARVACRGATAITGNAPAFVDWGLNYAGRAKAELDRDFPHGYSAATPPEDQLEKSRLFWENHGIKAGDGVPIVCFCGTIGHQAEFDTVLKAARIVNASRPVKFVLCGDGDRLQSLRAAAADCPQVVLPGWVATSDVWTLLRMSTAGLVPFLAIPNYIISISNKPIEYLSAGLPILLSLDRGMLHEVITENDCGISYGTDPVALAAAVLMLCNDAGRRAAMSANATALFQRRFTAAAVYRDMAEFLDAVVQMYGTTNTKAHATAET